MFERASYRFTLILYYIICFVCRVNLFISVSIKSIEIFDKLSSLMYAGKSFLPLILSKYRNKAAQKSSTRVHDEGPATSLV